MGVPVELGVAKPERMEGHGGCGIWACPNRKLSRYLWKWKFILGVSCGRGRNRKLRLSGRP